MESPIQSIEQVEKQLLRQYLDRLETRLSDMRRALAGEDWDILRLEIGRLHKSAHKFGLVQVADHCSLFENARNREQATERAHHLFSELDKVLCVNLSEAKNTFLH